MSTLHRRAPSPIARAVRGAALAGLAGAVLLAGCAGPRPPRPLPAPSGYEAEPEALRGIDTTPLAGRRIVLDPGHGGRFRGAIGPGGLAEADVNLGVALRLRGLLEWAGAEVTLTRTADYDLAGPADSSLQADLAARVAVVERVQPDVFLSIHHNSTAAGDSLANETQTYYPVGREGAALDLARAVHRQLVLHLGISPARLMPGNFHVLRNSPVPAVLGEPAMISHPGVERRLGLAQKQALEATAYFLGLLDYFAAGTPRWLPPVAAADATTGNGAGEGALRWRFDPGGPGAPPLDPTSVELTVDGRPAVVTVPPGGDVVAWWPGPRDACGDHRLALAGRNLRGRAAPTWRGVWRGRAPAAWTGSLWLEAAAPDGPPARALFRWRPAEPCGDREDPAGGGDDAGATAPEPSAAPLLLAGPATADTLDLPGGPAGGWLLLPADRLPAPPWRLGRRGAPGGPAPLDLDRHVLPPGWRWTELRAGAPWRGEVPGDAWRLRRLPDGAGPPPPPAAFDPRLPAVPLAASGGWWLEADGALPLLAPAADAAGTEAPPARLDWRPLLPELVGVVVVLDPAGGGVDDEGTAPLGTRGSDLDLRLAGMTAALLRGAGAEVHLTRRDDRWVAPEAKVLLANRVGADLFLVLGRDAPPGTARVRHHVGSVAGERWARLAGGLLAPLAGGGLVREPSYRYLLRQTACPALRVDLPLPATVEQEERQGATATLQAQARALLLATASLLADGNSPPPTLDPAALAAVRAAGADLAWARLDGNLLWLPSPPGGEATAPPLPARGPEHLLELRDRDGWQLWRLRREGAAWDEELLLDGSLEPPPPSSADLP